MSAIPRIFTATVTGRRVVAPGTTEVTFRAGDGPMLFEPGQYVRLTIPGIAEMDHKGDTRDLTISSPPNSDPSFSVSFMDSSSAFKQALIAAPDGFSVTVQGPLGHFILPADVTVPVIYIAGGTGVTPVMSMLRSMVQQGTDRDIQVIYASPSKDRAAFSAEIKDLSVLLPRIRFIEHIGPVDAKMLQSTIERKPDALWYLCGVPDMVLELSREIPQIFGVNPASIRTEEYPGYQVAVDAYRVLPPIPLAHMSEEDFTRDNELIATLMVMIAQGALVSVSDTQGTIVYLNQRMIDVSEFTRDELIGQNHRMLKSGFHPPAFFADLWKTISSGQTWRGEIRNQKKHGEMYWVDAIIAPIFDAKNRISRYLSVRFLVTEKKELEAARKELIFNVAEAVKAKKEIETVSQRLRMATQAARIGVWEWDLVHDSLVWDDRMFELYGTDRHEAVSASRVRQEGVHPDDRARVQAERQAAIDGKDQFETTFRIVWHGSTRYLHAVGDIVRDESGKALRMYGVDMDVTKEMEIDKLKTEFVSLAAHQLKTPVGAINWLLEMLASGDYGPVPEPQKKVLANIATMNIRMRDLVNSLLNISRLEMGVLVVIPIDTDVVALLKEVVLELQSRIDAKKHHIELHAPDSLVFPADPNLLRSVMVNYLSNAVKYTNDAGNIRVTLRKIGSEIVYSVWNDGLGIPEKDQDSIFKKFFRASNASLFDADGTGLGLYLVKQITEVAGGRVWFSSSDTAGTTFAAAFPDKGMKRVEGTKSLS